MKHETRTFTETVEYESFEPGERVRLIPSKAYALPGGCDVVHVVTKFHHPMHAGYEPMVFVEGHQYGMVAYYFQPADEPQEDA